MLGRWPLLQGGQARGSSFGGHRLLREELLATALPSLREPGIAIYRRSARAADGPGRWEL
eukprot:9617861-Alexandrium_andersonii.AAC.1